MSREPSNIPDSIRQKFPHLQPTKVPSLTTINGCGVTVYGKRDYDEETQTYVKTRCICLVYIPIFFLSAYRVADAGPRSWYFLGKDSLSNFARSWNMVMGLLLLVGGLTIGWNVHTSSPAYRAEQEIQRADTLMKSGKPVSAASVYRQQLGGPKADAARKGLGEAVEAALKSDNPQIVSGGLHAIAGLQNSVVQDPFRRGLELAQKFSSQNPDGALDVLNAAAAFDPKNKSIQPLRMNLLKTIVSTAPDKTNRVVELAVIYEAANQMDDAYALLRPYAHRLGATEGARILGQHLLQEGNYSDAYGLLFPYVSTRLGQMRSAESAYTNILATISREALDDLKKGRAGENFYNEYESAPKAKQQEMVDNYIESRTRTDARFERAVANLKAANEIVPVTLDLGIVQLNRAQTLSNPAERKAELEAAEKTFLAIRGFAGETDEYRMFLGQVYYWLGRSKEGKDLFDQLLASRKRAFSILMSITTTLRAVGETAEARTMAEEAYHGAKTDKEKFIAAGLRALLFKDLDDQIAWLELRDPNDLMTQVELNCAKGEKALNQGNKTLAASLSRKAIAGYEGLSKSSTTLNNCGLAYFQLYEATGNPDDHRRGMALLEEAVAMDPSDSVLLHNTVYCLIGQAIMDVTQDSIGLEALGKHPGFHALAHLYQNEQERSQIYRRLKENDTMKKALVYLDKALLLAPKNIQLYYSAKTLHSGFRDLDELKKLDQRFQVAAPNVKENQDEILESYSGKKDAKFLTDLQSDIKILRETLALPSISSHPLSSEHLNVSLIYLLESCRTYGGSNEAAALLHTATDLYQKHRSAATGQALKSVYLYCATEELSQQNVEFQSVLNRSRHTLSGEQIICLALEHGGTLGDAVKKNQYVAKAAAIEKENAALYPSWANIGQWALLREFEPAVADSLAVRIKSNDMIRLADEMEFKFNPLSGSSIVEQYWTQKLLGNDKHAQEIYQTAIKEGVPLPML